MPRSLFSDKIGPDDPRYADLVGKRFNKRFTSQGVGFGTIYYKEN